MILMNLYIRRKIGMKARLIGRVESKNEVGL